MSTIKSSTDHLTLNADGASKDIKFQANGVEKASISSAGAFTSTTIDATKLTGNLPAISGASLTGVGGLYASVAIIADQKVYTSHGGTFTSGAWRTRDLNTEVSDADGIVSISSNQFTLGTGTYTIEYGCPAYQVGRHFSRLYNTSDSTIAIHGTSEYAHANGIVVTRSVGKSVITVASSKTFEIQHYGDTTVTTTGLGTSQALDSTGYSVFTFVKILKHS